MVTSPCTRPDPPIPVGMSASTLSIQPVEGGALATQGPAPVGVFIVITALIKTQGLCWLSEWQMGCSASYLDELKNEPPKSGLVLNPSTAPKPEKQVMR